MATATKADLLGLPERRYMEVRVPGLPAPVRIQSLNESERSAIEYSVAYADDEKRYDVACTVKARWFVAAVVDGGGLRMFMDADVDRINGLDSRLVNAVADAIVDFNDVSEEDRKTLLGNSSGAPADSSPTDSPATSDDTT